MIPNKKTTIYLFLFIFLTSFKKPLLQAMERDRAPTITNDEFNTTLQEAIIGGYSNIVRDLPFSKTFDPTNAKDLNLAFILFSLTGKLKRIKELLEDSEKHKYVSVYGANNAIKLAAIAGQYDTLQYLFNQNIISEKVTLKGLREALSFASSQGHYKTVKYIINFLIKNDTLYNINENNVTDSSLICACSNGKLAVIMVLLNNFIIVNYFTQKDMQDSS